MRPSTRLRLVLTELVVAACAGLLPALLLGVYGLFADSAPGRTTLLVTAALGALGALWLWLLHLSGRIKSSRRRMADPMYRAKLAAFEMAVAAERERALAS